MIQIINDIDFCLKQGWFCKYMNYEMLQELLEDNRFKGKDFLEIPEWVGIGVGIYYKGKTPEESFIFIKEKEYSQHFEWDESDYNVSPTETPFIEGMMYRKDGKHFIYKNGELIPYNT